MKRLCPGSFQYAVVRMDPVAMVEHYQDPIAMAEARALPSRKYLAYLDLPLDLPLHESAWFRFQISLIGTTLRPEEPDRGITSDMAIPIYPNSDHPHGRDPLKPETPFPFHHCYHWIENTTTVRIRRRDDLYDDGDAVKLGTRQHLAMERMFSDDYDHMETACEVMYASDPVWRAMHPCESDDDSDEEDRMDVRGRSKRASHGPRAGSSPDSCLSDDSDELTRTAHQAGCSHKADSSVNDLLTMDVFNLAHDDDDQFLPLVDLWFDLAAHLSEEDIPNPLEFYKEQDAMKKFEWLYTHCGTFADTFAELSGMRGNGAQAHHFPLGMALLTRTSVPSAMKVSMMMMMTTTASGTMLTIRPMTLRRTHRRRMPSAKTDTSATPRLRQPVRSAHRRRVSYPIP
ncbi:hypothetical protein C8Q73DRAFT_653752 [Cubamyces lactineus]|nr:hypothetical protein C8Q73DRAFT_653752 [Cubamyces lactineus]